MTDLGLLTQFISLEIEQYYVGIKVIQSKYVAYLLLKFNMTEFKEAKFPFLSGVKLGEFGSSPLVDNSLYRKLVGSLLYLAHYRHELYYDVGVVASYMQEIHEIHWKDSKRILHYVQGTKHFGVHDATSSPLELVGFAHSDWDGDSIKIKYTSGYVFMLENGPIFW